MRTASSRPSSRPGWTTRRGRGSEPLPRGHGFLGLIIRENASFRIPDIAVDERRYGFPPNHPPMHSFLGVPVTVKGRSVGNLYFTDKAGGELFTAADQALVETFARHAAIAIENARLHEQVQRLAVVDERERISKDLHDGIIQSIYAVGLSLEDVPELMEEDPDEVVRRVEHAIDSLHLAIRDIRNFIFGLRPELLSGMSLMSGLAATAEEFRHNSMIDVELEAKGPIAEPTADTTAHLLGIVHEIARQHRAALGCVAGRDRRSRVIRWRSRADHRRQRSWLRPDDGGDARAPGARQHARTGRRHRCDDDHRQRHDHRNDGSRPPAVTGDDRPPRECTVMSEDGEAAARVLSILVVDDHEVVRQGLSAMLDRRPGFQVVAEAGTVAEALDAARRFRPDLVVMDVRLPDGSGVEACRDIRAEMPETRVVMLTSYPDEEAVLAAIIAGASGYLLKQVRARDLVAGLEAVGRGESLLDPAVTGKVLERMRRIATSDEPDELGRADLAGAQDPGPRRGGDDQQGDRGRGLPVGQDREELRQLDPGQAQPRAACTGGCVRRQAQGPGPVPVLRLGLGR